MKTFVKVEEQPDISLSLFNAQNYSEITNHLQWTYNTILQHSASQCFTNRYFIHNARR